MTAIKYLWVCFEERTDMGNAENLLSKMNKQYQNFSKGQKKLATYINDNYDKAAFLTAAKLGRRLGSVSLRWCVLLSIWGIKGIRSFRRLWRNW